ncbi:MULTISPECIES: PAS domain S-box protein [unclassified Sphingomonas]|uniref:PAS domain S-box protein n=1 Tax=unclassified Sphingomonas TaxID=196159 RepID=UPI001F1DE78E|nr:MULTISPECIES: PAS domain S-box protein [unclassified Sphingomonas]
MAADRRTLGFMALFAAIIVVAIVKAAYLHPPFGRADTIQIALLIVAGVASAGAMMWSWRAHVAEQGLIERRDLVDAVDLAAVMVVDEEGTIRHWSRGCEELYGWPAAAAVGRKRIDLLGTQMPVSMEELWRQLRAAGRLSVELVERHRDGHELIVHDHAKLVQNGTRRHSAVVAVTDVTEWRRAEEALRLSEARLATSVAVQGIFIYEYDLVAGQPIWTTSGDIFFGLGGNEAGTGPRYWSEALDSQVREVVEAAVANGQDRAHFDFDFRHPDGAARRAEGWARIIRSRDGRPVRLLGTHLDVTERREREQELRAGEAERQAILATVPDAMFVCDARGHVRACSATACQLLGYSEGELIGVALSDLVENRRGPAAMRRDLARARKLGPGGQWPVPVNVRRADGEHVPISFVLGDAFVEGTRMYVVFGRDMRPTIATEERFHRLNNDLAQVSRLGMMGEMAGALAHELSQPLSAIVNFLGAVDLMLDSGDGTDVARLRQALQRASEQASRAGEIIRRLRAFILRGEADMRAEPLTSLVREAAALALFNSSSFGIRLFYDFENEGRIVLGDRIQIQQVLVNLIRNAADAMTTQGNGRRELLISTKMARDNLIELMVKDSGPGIAPEILERLFSPFATTKREGLGFGLAISRRIIEAHGGQLSAASAQDGGAIFRFTLPVMEEEAAR